MRRLAVFWGNDMSGLEPILIGAALGAGTSAVTGGNPLTGAIIGGATGGIGSGVGGAAGAGTFGGTALPAGSMTASGALTNAGANAFMSGTGAGVASGVSPLAAAGTNSFATAAPVLPPSGAIGPATYGSITPTEFMGLPFGEQLSLAGDSLSGLADIDLDTLSGVGNMMGGQQEQQQQSLSAPPVRRGQQVNVSDPIFALLEEQRRPQERGRISLL